LHLVKRRFDHRNNFSLIGPRQSRLSTFSTLASLEGAHQVSENGEQRRCTMQNDSSAFETLGI